MKMTKKVLGILLALSMLVGVFSVMASALAPDSAVDLLISVDKATYAPGDEIVLTLSEQVIAAVGNMTIGGQYTIGYDSAVVKPYHGTSTTLEDHGFSAIAPGYDSSMSTISFNANNVANGDYIDDSQAAYGWDETIMYAVATLGDEFDATTTPVDLFSVKMKIADDAAPGTYTIGFNAGAYINFTSYADDAINHGIWGHDPSYPGVAANFTYGTCTFTVASAAPTSILNPGKSQIRFDKNDDGTYANKFAVRQLAVISGADFENTFGATPEAQKAAIAEVGYVFARTSTVAKFDVDTAKALIENGTAAAGYTKLTVDYITTKADLVGEGNYGFSCIVTDIPAADNGDGVYALAYIKGTDGTFHYYPSAAPTPFNDLYTRNYSTAFPG
ncbi:MAG: hypothetical protein ACI4N4_05695 [Candidatus Fimenecus sp.]